MYTITALTKTASSPRIMESTHGHGLYFTFDRKVLVLFKGWEATKLEVLIPVALAVGLISAYFTFKQFRNSTHDRKTRLRNANSREQQISTLPHEATISTAGQELDTSNGGDSRIGNCPSVANRRGAKIFSREHVFGSVVYLFDATLRLMLMLIVMTYCVWFLVAILAGAAFGFLVWCAGRNGAGGNNIGPGREAEGNANTGFQQDETVAESVRQF